MSFMNKVMKFERISFYVSLLVVGVLFVVVSGIILSQPDKEYSSTQGRIQRIDLYVSDDEINSGRVFVTYTDGDGVRHENIEYPSYSSSMKEGDIVEVLYDPEAPEEISAPGVKTVLYVFLAVGILSILIVVIKFAMAFIRGRIVA